MNKTRKIYCIAAEVAIDGWTLSLGTVKLVVYHTTDNTREDMKQRRIPKALNELLFSIRAAS